MKYVTVSDFLTEGQMRQVYSLYTRLKSQGKSYLFVSRLAEEVIQPNLSEINRKLGQDNSPHYVAKKIEAALVEAIKIVENRRKQIVTSQKSAAAKDK